MEVSLQDGNVLVSNFCWNIMCRCIPIGTCVVLFSEQLNVFHYTY